MTPTMIDGSSILVTFILAAASVVAAVAAWSTLWFSSKSHKRNGLLKAFKLLNEHSHREARLTVYALYDVHIHTKDLKKFAESDPSRQGVEMVRADFDQMSTLVRNGSTIKKRFFNRIRRNCL